MRDVFKRARGWIKSKFGRKQRCKPSKVGGFTNISFPIVRRVYPQLIASQLVSVQPMSVPAGGIFTLFYTYENCAVMYFYSRAPRDCDVDLGHVIAHCARYSDIDHDTLGRWTFSSMRVKR